MTKPIAEFQEILTNEAGEILYPDSDGKPMADNTKQFEWITTIKGNLDSIFSENTDVFVAGDLLWYPVEGEPKIRVAPDVMVAFGRPKGHRGSYQQWKENNIAPQVVFEILSPGNSTIEMLKKGQFYERYGVIEYYIYDPDKNALLVYQRQGSKLEAREIDEEIIEWKSPLLNIRFVLEAEELMIYDPSGNPFLTYVEAKEELKQAKEAEQKAVEKAEQAKEAEQKAVEKVEQAKEAEQKAVEKVEQAKEAEQKAMTELNQAKQEEEKALNEKEMEIARLKELMRQAGLDLKG